MTDVPSEPATKADLIVLATKADLALVKADVAELKTDVAELKTDVAELKTDMTDVKAYMATLATKAELKAEVAALRDEMLTKKHLEAWGEMLMRRMDGKIDDLRTELRTEMRVMVRDLDASLGRHVQAANEEMRIWMNAERERTDAALARHASDTTLHRQPRRRRSS